MAKLETKIGVEDEKAVDINLVASYLSGDQRAFEALYQRHHAWFLVFAQNNLPYADDVPELLQNSWAVMTRQDVLSRVNDERSFKKLFKSVLWFQYLAHRVSEKRFNKPLKLLNRNGNRQFGACVSFQPDHVADIEMMDFVDSVLGSGRSESHELVMMVMEGFSAEEAAAKLEMTVSSYTSKLFRARQFWRQAYPEKVGKRGAEDVVEIVGEVVEHLAELDPEAAKIPTTF